MISYLVLSPRGASMGPLVLASPVVLDGGGGGQRGSREAVVSAPQASVWFSPLACFLQHSLPLVPCVRPGAQMLAVLGAITQSSEDAELLNVAPTLPPVDLLVSAVTLNL